METLITYEQDEDQVTPQSSNSDSSCQENEGSLLTEKLMQTLKYKYRPMDEESNSSFQ
jgi:hypothetical protein